VVRFRTAPISPDIIKWRPAQAARRIRWQCRATVEWLDRCRVRQTAEQARANRLTVLLAILCVLHAFDLAFTQTQLARPNFAEVNPLARFASSGMPNDAGRIPYRVAAFKCTSFAVGVLMLWAMRRRWQAECGAWFLLGVSTALMVWWTCYLKELEVCLRDLACVRELVAY
jgi:hypothetical protein